MIKWIDLYWECESRSVANRLVPRFNLFLFNRYSGFLPRPTLVMHWSSLKIMFKKKKRSYWWLEYWMNRTVHSIDRGYSRKLLMEMTVVDNLESILLESGGILDIWFSFAYDLTGLTNHEIHIQLICVYRTDGIIIDWNNTTDEESLSW